MIALHLDRLTWPDIKEEIKNAHLSCQVIILAIFLNNDRRLNPSFDSKKAEKTK